MKQVRKIRESLISLLSVGDFIYYQTNPSRDYLHEILITEIENDYINLNVYPRLKPILKTRLRISDRRFLIGSSKGINYTNGYIIYVTYEDFNRH